MKILITSDNHLGFKEMDPVRAEDSFTTFEEIMNIAKTEDVDFVIQGGDLFDENRPSRNTYNKAIQIFKKHCLGSRAQRFTATPQLNDRNENLNVALPILSIHGNHDDPSGFNSVSPLDVVHSSGLINYFGRVECVDQIEINPILIEGSRKIAVYGLGHIKDRRIQKTFMNKKVKYNKPSGDGWYSILVVHQNRTPREGGYLSEDLIDSFFDLVVYGHEHESIKIQHRNFDVIQCGSTVRTSLCEGEAEDKYVYILEFTEKVVIRRTKLETVRPLIIDTIKLNRENADRQLERKITEMLDVNEKTTNMLPLFRLRIDISNTETYSKQKVNEYISGKIANPADAIRILRKAEKVKGTAKSIIQTLEIKDLFKNILDTVDLKALIQPKIMDSLSDFIEKDIKEAFNRLVSESVRMIVESVDFEGFVAERIEESIKQAVNIIKKKTVIEEQKHESDDFVDIDDNTVNDINIMQDRKTGKDSVLLQWCSKDQAKNKYEEENIENSNMLKKAKKEVSDFSDDLLNF